MSRSPFVYVCYPLVLPKVYEQKYPSFQHNLRIKSEFGINIINKTFAQ